MLGSNPSADSVASTDSGGMLRHPLSSVCRQSARIGRGTKALNPGGAGATSDNACTGDFASFDNPGRAGEFRCLGQRVVSILCCPLLQGKWDSQQDLLNFTGGSSEMRH